VSRQEPGGVIRNRNWQRTLHRAPLLMSVTRECTGPFYRAFAAVLKACCDFREIGMSPWRKPPVGEAYALSRLNKSRQIGIPFRSSPISVAIFCMNARVSIDKANHLRSASANQLSHSGAATKDGEARIHNPRPMVMRRHIMVMGQHIYFIAGRSPEPQRGRGDAQPGASASPRPRQAARHLKKTANLQRTLNVFVR